MNDKYVEQRVYISLISPSAYWEQFYKDSEDKKETKK